MMSRDKDLAAIEYEGWRLIELGRQTPERVVPQYPTWTMRDLVVHTAEVHGRTAAVCESLPAERIAGAELPQEADPFEWAAEQLARMLEGLAMADPDAHVWTFVDDPALRFWIRRMVVETGVHRWDAHSAVGEPVELLTTCPPMASTSSPPSICLASMTCRPSSSAPPTLGVAGAMGQANPRHASRARPPTCSCG